MGQEKSKAKAGKWKKSAFMGDPPLIGHFTTSCCSFSSNSGDRGTLSSTETRTRLREVKQTCQAHTAKKLAEPGFQAGWLVPLPPAAPPVWRPQNRRHQGPGWGPGVERRQRTLASWVTEVVETLSIWYKRPAQTFPALHPQQPGREEARSFVRGHPHPHPAAGPSATAAQTPPCNHGFLFGVETRPGQWGEGSSHPSGRGLL